MIDRERCGGGLVTRNRLERHLPARIGSDVEVLQIGGPLLPVGVNLHHDSILVQLREHDRDLALAEGIVQGVVDHLRRYAVARSSDPVDDQLRLQAQALLIAGNVAQVRNGLELLDEAIRPLAQLFRVRVFQAVLVLGAADAVLDGQILHGLHEELDAIDFLKFRLQAANHRTGIDLSHVERFEIDLDAPAVNG